MANKDNDKGKVVDIGAAVKQAQDQAREGLPTDVAKLAIWRKGLQSPITFVVKEDVGREVQLAWRRGVNADNPADHDAYIMFETYNDGSGRKSITTMRCGDVAGLTLEFATLQLALGG